MVRAVGGLALLLVVMAAQPSLFGYLALRRPGVHLIRNGTHFIANICWTNAVIAAAARDRVRDRVHDAGLGGPARGAASSASASR